MSRTGKQAGPEKRAEPGRRDEPGRWAGPVGAEETRALYRANPQDEINPPGGIAGIPVQSGAELRRRTRPERKTPRRDRDSSGLRRLIRVLGGAACALILLILGGTFYAVFRDSGEPYSGGPVPEDSGPAGPSDVFLPGDVSLPGAYPRSAVFTGLGRLRIPAGSGSPPASGVETASRAVVVLSVVFPYPPEDRPFTEELAGKISLFRRIIQDYFGALSRDELNPLDEQKAKEELLRRFNGELRLGKIESLLFNDLMILE